MDNHGEMLIYQTEDGLTKIDEYSYAMKSLFREIGNQMSGTGNHHLLSASLLAHVFV